MSAFDANTWIGRWPFAFLTERSPRSLTAHLRARGIDRAIVSPLDAVFAPEPGPANRALLRSTRSIQELVPVPVINPALANWRDELDVCTRDPRVRMVRVLPSYHGIRLGSRAMTALLVELRLRGVRLAIQIRLIDERHEHHALRIKPVSLRELSRLLAAHSGGPVLVSGLLRSEMKALAPEHPHMLADLSFAEWHETVQDLLAKVRLEQLVFASHTPFLVTSAASAKIAASGLKGSRLASLSFRNLERFLQT